MKKSLVFFGTEHFSSDSLAALIKSGWDIKAVVTKPDAKKGRGQKIVSPEVKLLAEKAKIPVLQPDKPAKIKHDLMSLDCDYAVLVAYGKIIPQDIIDVFAGGIVNLHPSLLPKYRGPSPVEAAILNGDNQTGISLMKLTSQMDGGPVYTQKTIPLSGTETQPQLHSALSLKGAAFLADSLPDIISGQLSPKEQDESKATYTQLLTKDDGILDTSRPAEQLERQVRALCSWPRCRLSIFGKEIIVTRGRLASHASDGSLVIECQPGYLEIIELVVPGRGPMSGHDFKLGYQKD